MTVEIAVVANAMTSELPSAAISERLRQKVRYQEVVNPSRRMLIFDVLKE